MKNTMELAKTNIVSKMMFIAVVARPRYDPYGKQFFDGKIQMWSFVYQELTKRNLKKLAKRILVI